MTRKLFLLVLLMLPVHSWAKWDCNDTVATCGDRTTKQQFPGGVLHLHWMHVYEGQDTVFRMDFPRQKGLPSAIEVEGQPIFNKAKTFVALPYCADDGCNAEVTVINLISRKAFPPIKLPYEGQFYVVTSWRNDLLLLRIEFPQHLGKASIEHWFKVSGSGLIEQMKSNSSFNADPQQPRSAQQSRAG